MAKNWKLKSSPYSTLADSLLYHRGLKDAPEIEKFLNPKYEDLHNPFLFLDMQKAVDRIWRAIENDEPICIYGDYDADAVTANAVVQLALRTPWRCGSSSMTRTSSASQVGVIVGGPPGAVRRGIAASPPARKRCSTRKTVS